MKKRKCKWSKCGKIFNPNPFRFNQQTCDNIMCALGYTRDKEAKKWEKEKKNLKESLKSHSQHLKELQTIFNRYIVLRDSELPCISCGTKKEGIQYHAGHYWSVGSYPNLRFNDDNVHKQCGFNCNTSKHGNIAEYTPNLIAKIGLERFETLKELRRLPLKLSINEIVDLKMKYKKIIKEIK